MAKRLFTFLLCVLFVAIVAQAQDNSLDTRSKILVDDNKAAEQFYPQIAPTKITAGVPIGVTTDYDYFSNSVIRDQITFDQTNNVVHLANMIRPGLVTPAAREVVHTFGLSGSWTNQSVTGAQSGWPHIDQSLTGSALGTVGIALHVPNQLAIWDDGTGYIVSTFAPSSDPSLQFSGENIFLATSGDRIQFQFYSTADFGVTFTNWDSIGGYHPTPIWWKANGGVEVGMSKSANEDHVVYFGTNQGNTLGAGGSSTAHVFNGYARDSADVFWAIHSTDGGTNWSPKTFAWDGDVTMLPSYHTPNYAPLFENFAQVDMAVSNAGVLHAVANGYGVVLNATLDTVIADSYPVLYWNSNADTWVSISDEAIDTIQGIIDYFPTNCLGQSYPSISVSENGQVVYALWTGPQLDATGGLDTASNGGTAMYFWRDLYHAFSTNGGTTWNYGGTFPDMSSTLSETYGHAAQLLEQVDATTYRAHIVYIADQTTGVGPFDGILTDNDIVYATFDITAASLGDEQFVNSFELGQNYPNPFNPSTKIDYTISERSAVTLKVYDVLGNEVASLVNATQEAGKHTVNFDASKLSSGLYIYTLSAGNFTSSKKMMLLK